MNRVPRALSNALCWLAYNLAGILIPVGISIIAVYAMRLTPSVSAITSGGQFAIYSAAMSVTTMYLIAKPDPRRLRFTEVFQLLCLLTFAGGIILFLLAILRGNGVEIAAWVLEWPSIALFVGCAGVTFCAVVADNRRSEMSPSELFRETESTRTSLNRDFDNTR